MMENNSSRQNLKATLAIIALLIGAIGSLYFMFKAGSHQKSILLIALFTGWVLSPFVALWVANKITSVRSVITEQLLYGLMFGLTIVSLIAYSGLVAVPNTKPAFIYLAFPFVSWLAFLIIFLIAKRRKPMG